ncbi:SDR family oxidoreductase [Antrihabitans sp. YC2-6]|uniref:SDR family oxidoreductase n=1 Tax=Antrihabitans sp. YC2-6 TaxID=2799498 RepID=UPI0018F794FA|nr:SDR family oxidoreductase [Antrihabitans sp. YC2-6]MBJ8347483.1 SDR family oxidoreductase [Antrihabitans sp. YC2-6]
MRPRSIVITGAASGIGAATAAQLTASGHRVVGIDLRNSDITADLSTTDGRSDAVAAAADACDGVVDGLVCCAGLGPLSGHSGELLVSVNYFGATAVLRGLRPALERSESASAVAISSSSTTTQPMIPDDVVAACLDDREEDARSLAQNAGAIAAYPASKLALAHWVRREAVQPQWVRAGIRLNAVAPGMIDTPMTTGAEVDPQLAQALSHYPIPMKRAGRAEEVAALIEFLLGSGASLLCGSVIFADGGTDAQLRGSDWPAAWAPTPERLAELFR